MPQSRHRHKHGHAHHRHAKPAQQHTAARPPQRRSAITIMVIFLAIFGIGIAWITAGASFVWLAVGALAGAVVGYFIGQSMDKVAAKEK